MIWLVPAFFILGWFGCGYVGAAHSYAYFTLEYARINSRKERIANVLFGLFLFVVGPFSIFGLLVERRDHGFCWDWWRAPDLVGKQNLPSHLNIPGYASYNISKPKPKLKSAHQTTPIIGYRVWNIDRETCTLTSMAYSADWPHRKPLERGTGEKAKGIHAAKDKSAIQTLWSVYSSKVAGTVSMWGEVTECERGYLAEFAYPKELWMPEDTDPVLVMQLEENYGVPVLLKKELQPTLAGRESFAAALSGIRTSAVLGAPYSSSPLSSPFSLHANPVFTATASALRPMSSYFQYVHFNYDDLSPTPETHKLGADDAKILPTTDPITDFSRLLGGADASLPDQP